MTTEYGFQPAQKKTDEIPLLTDDVRQRIERLEDFRHSKVFKRLLAACLDLSHNYSHWLRRWEGSSSRPERPGLPEPHFEIRDGRGLITDGYRAVFFQIKSEDLPVYEALRKYTHEEMPWGPRGLRKLLAHPEATILLEVATKHKETQK